MRTKRKILSLILAICLVVGMMPTVVLAANGEGFSYVDANGVAQTPVDATVLSGTISEDIGVRGQETWYIVTESATIGQYIKFVGTVNLILADGATLTSQMTGTRNAEDTLIIWGQEQGTGTFNATAGEWEAGIQLQGGSLVINGGNVNATGCTGPDSAGNGAIGENFKSITINGGTVNATATKGPAIGSNSNSPIIITGGKITLNSPISGIQTGNKGSVTVSGGTIANQNSGKVVINSGLGSVEEHCFTDGIDTTKDVHIHSWSTDWSSTGTHHWHECLNDGCPITENSEKNGYGEHTYTYGDSTEDTIVEKCEYCDSYASAQIKKPTGELTYDGNQHRATVVYTGTLSCGNDLSISYGDAEFIVNPGNYIASITFGGKTASVQYNIGKATPTVDTNPTASEIIIGNALSTSTLTGGVVKGVGGAELKGTFTWKDGTEVMNTAGTLTKKVVFAPDNTHYNTVEIDVNVTVEYATHVITIGEKQEVTMGNDATFVSDADFAKFIKIQVDGKAVDSKYYTVESGSTKTTLKKEFIDTLSVGEHTLSIVSTDGTATTTFTVKAKSVVPADDKKPNTEADVPQTGDNSNMMLWIDLMLASVATIVALVLSRRKRQTR